MADQVLSRTQRNEVFEMTRRLGLDPADFAWSCVTTANEGPKEIVVHQPTRAFVEFSFSRMGDGLWLTWWPDQNRGRGLETASTWREASVSVLAWLTGVKADHETPDLWGEIAKQQVIPSAAGRSEYDMPFAPDELKRLGTALADIERFIVAAEPLDEPRRQEVRKRFAYLLEAAESGARKIDWLNIFVAQIVGMVTAGFLDARIYGAVMSHAATVLNAIFQFGIKLLK